MISDRTKELVKSKKNEIESQLRTLRQMHDEAVRNASSLSAQITALESDLLSLNNDVADPVLSIEESTIKEV